MKKIAVILSGCGFQDGAEITESVSTLIALAEAGVSYQIFAPQKSFTSVNHLSGETQGTRSSLEEANRIGRGKVQDLKELNPENFDGLVLPGGYGAAKVLCDFAEKGAGCTVDPTVEKVITAFYKQEKPIAAICIAPALVAKVLGKNKITVTIGDDKGTAGEIAKTGAIHEDCKVEDYVTDRDHRIITTPAYMYDEATPAQVFKGVRGAIRELVGMA